MLWRKLIFVVVFFAMFGASGAYAQQSHEIEVTPFGGVRFGGIIDYSASNSGSDVDYLRIRNSSNYGAMLDYSIWPSFQAEFMWNQQPTQLGAHSISTDTITPYSSADLTMYQFGFLYEFRSSEAKIRPFVVGGLGFTHFSTGEFNGQNLIGFTNRFSYNLGLGAKYFFSPHVGLRMEARWAPTRTTNGTGQYCDPFSGFCYPIQTTNHAEQGMVNIGVIFRFR